MDQVTCRTVLPSISILPLWGADLASAALTSLCISPAVCLIDMSIASKVATGKPILSHAAQTVRNPRALLRNLLASPAGRWVYGVYFATFASANTIDTALSQQGKSAVEDKAARLTKFAIVSIVSTAATVWKDVRLAHCFVRAGQRPAAVPASSIGLFVARDCVTIFSSFILPPIVARRLTGAFEKEASNSKIAQLTLPMAFQVITTPIHLGGYYLHHDRVKRGFIARCAQIKQDMSTAMPIRMIRILPAMGMGNVLNTSTREHLTSWLENKS